MTHLLQNAFQMRLQGRHDCDVARSCRSLTADHLVVDVQGVGYHVFAPSKTVMELVEGKNAFCVSTIVRKTLSLCMDSSARRIEMLSIS